MTAPADDFSDFVDEPSQPRKRPGRRFPFGTTLAVLGLIVIAIALLLPATRSARPAARRIQCTNNLKQIALALLQYESTYHALPPAHTVDSAGRPLHSWRTLILPFLGEQPLYETIDLAKPWNDPANAKARAAVVSAYRCPALTVPPDINNTTYLAIVAADGCFLPDKSRRLSEITDDRGLTLMVIEVPSDLAVPWMAPTDAHESLVMLITPQSKLDHPGGMNAAYVDGSSTFLFAKIPAEQRRALISIAGDDDKVAKGPD